ncbi:hemolysin-type calcium-binding region, partial [Elysia marginata]
ETSGDLRLKEAISASGDVYINVASGSLKDANDSAVRDDRTYDELLNGVWSDLQLTDGTGAQSKIDQTLIDYASNREQEYEAYWQYRGMQADSSVYDPNFVVSLSSDEQTYYTNAGWTDGEIQTLVNKRTEEYHSLHGQYGSYGDSYNDSFTYTLSDAERDSLTASIKVWTEDELLNLFSAGLIEPITDTQTSVEQANISAAGAVTIVASGSVGSATGSQVIDLSGPTVSLTDDERVALAAAERTDVAYLAGDIASAKVNFLNNGNSADTIVRTDGGNWLTDGFQAGMTIQIFGTADNANDNGQFFTIDSVSSNTITLSADDQLSTEYRAKITLAEIIADPTVDGASITGIRIDLRDDVDVDALGSVSATGSGDVFLGSELDVKLDTVVAGDTVRIKTGKSIINAGGSSVTNVTSSDVILEAADGSIGSASDQIYINLAADAIFTARVSGDIYLTERTDNINVGTLYAQSGGIYLTAESGAIVDGLDHDFANISAATELSLTASAGVGEDGDYLETDLATDATLTIAAGADVYVHEVLGNMNIREVLADGGNVDLRAHLAIKDTEDASGDVVTGLPEADVIGNSITLTSENDAIGISGNDLDINSAYRSAGTVTTSSALNTYLIETAGDLSINTIGTGSDYTAFILGRDNILNGNADANASNVTSGKTRLFAEGDIGASGKRLQTTVGYMEGRSTSGNVWITNTGHLTIGGLDQVNGIVATGTVNIEAHSPITVEKSIITDDDILLYAGEDNNDVAGEEDDLTVKAGVTIQSTAGTVTLRAGDNLMIESGAMVSALGNLLLQGDYENLDAAGTTIHNLGTLSGANITIEGEAGSD